MLQRASEGMWRDRVSVQADALDEVVDQGQRAQALGVKVKPAASLVGSRGLRAWHSGATINDRIAKSNTHAAFTRTKHQAGPRQDRRRPGGPWPTSSTCARARCTCA